MAKNLAEQANPTASQRENEWCMRGIAGDAYADGVQDCLKEIVSRSYIARRKQIEAQRKRSEQVDDKK